MKAKTKAAICLTLCLGFAASVSAEEYNPDYSAAMLSLMGEGITPQEQQVEAVEDIVVQEVAIDKESYTTDVLTVRELPGTEYAEVGKLSQYTKVHIIAVCDNGWSKVQMESGQTGYVSNDYISDVVPAGAENIGESLGVFTITYYCACEICCGWWSGGPTASGAYPVADWTVAADPDVLPLGTRIYINGHEYCVEDTGSGVEGAHIDIYVTDHDLAVNNGVASAEVFASK
ncbi:MAG: 3D domain-containing protein [Eubacteriales bacterium]|nr:3D domain-containing protein [Eubacteriales bacterium]